MEEEKIIENINEKVNDESETNVFAGKVRYMSKVTYFFISLLNVLYKALMWVVDLVWSMVSSLGHFFKMIGVGIYKGIFGIGKFFKNKAHEFKFNDLSGRLSFGLFGTSNFKHKQYVVGTMYIVFEIAYIVLFALFGASSIGMLGTLGTKETISKCPPDEMICETQVGDNSILILIYGLLWVLSIFLFLYVWNKSIESGYKNYRIDKFMQYDACLEKNIPFSRELDSRATEAFEKGITLKEFNAEIESDINSHLEEVASNDKEKDYLKYLFSKNSKASYDHLKVIKKENEKLEVLKTQLDKLVSSREEGLKEVIAKHDLALENTDPDDEEKIDKINAKVEVYKNNTMLKTHAVEAKIAKQQHKIQEINKRYTPYVEMHHTHNKEKFGKNNDYYKHVASLDSEILFYSNYAHFQEIYEDRFGKSDDKNKDNANRVVELENELNQKLAATTAKFNDIRARKADIQKGIDDAKATYDSNVATLKQNQPEGYETLILEEKSKLIEITTKLMAQYKDFPSDKSIKTLEKEEIKESKDAYKRDKKYLRTNFTAEQYALEEVINSMLVDYKIEYGAAKEFSKLLLVKEGKETRFLTTEEITSKLNELEESKNQYVESHPDKYEGKPDSFKQNVKDLFNEKFHITILTLPVLGIVLMTVLPLLFSIVVAFTNYSKGHIPPMQLFTWNGLENFQNLLFPAADSQFALLPTALGKTVVWTFVWAIIATFSNYFLGIIVALMINKKGIKFKKLWRTIFVMTIAVPQFISLLSIGVLLKDTGAIGTLVQQWTGHRMGFGTNTDESAVVLTKFIIILVNIWVGIPYTILSTTGILINIPKDLYESARVDGAGTVTQLFKITMPYILFVTGPYLITQFIGNFNNFGVIFFLTNGGPSYEGSALLGLGKTDLLITFLYKIVTSSSNPQYGIAAAIGIIIFVLCSFVSIVMYNKTGAVKEEDQFQ
jgi:arabinogalactan oligomer / maltooligosaccharide transport system permease protein